MCGIRSVEVLQRDVRLRPAGRGPRGLPARVLPLRGLPLDRAWRALLLRGRRPFNFAFFRGKKQHDIYYIQK